MFESRIAAKTLLVALNEAGGAKATRERVLQPMGTTGRVDLGSHALTSSPTSCQGSALVDLTILSRANRFVQ